MVVWSSRKRLCSGLQTDSCKATRDRAVSDVEAAKSGISGMKKEAEGNARK